MHEGAPPSRGSIAATVLLLGLTIAVYLPSLAGDWTGWDDTAYVLNNPAMQQGAEGLVHIWRSSSGEQYYPLTFTLYWSIHALFADATWAYHAASVLLHAISAALVLRLARALGIGGVWGVGVAFLFALHPTQVMSVAWIAELKNTLSGFFCLFAMLAWTRSRDPRAGGRGWYWLGAALFLAALLSKTALLGVPLAWILLDRFWFRSTWGSSIARSIVPLFCGVALASITLLFEERFVGRQAVPVSIDLASRVQIAGIGPWVYLAKYAWPAGLSPAYPLWNVGADKGVMWLPAGGLALAGLLVTAYARRLDGRITWGLAHFICVLAPTLGLIPYGNLALTYVSDHFLYMAGPGLSIAFVVALRPRLPVGLRKPAIALGALLGLVMAAGSLIHSRVFRDGEAMWARAVEIAPDSYVAHMALGESLRGVGKLTGAVKHMRYATELRSDLPDAFIFLAAAQRQIGNPAGARESYELALKADPESIDALVGLGGLLHEQRNGPRALETFERALHALGQHPEPIAEEMVRMGLGEVYLGFGRAQDAMEQFQIASRLRKGNTRAFLGLATSLRSLSRDTAAIAALNDGLAVSPDDVPLHNMLAVMLLSAKDESARNPALAVRHAIRAAELTHRENPHVLRTLAQAHASAGDLDQAASVAQEAADLAQTAGDHALASTLRDERESYIRR